MKITTTALFAAALFAGSVLSAQTSAAQPVPVPKDRIVFDSFAQAKVNAPDQGGTVYAFINQHMLQAGDVKEAKVENGKLVVTTNKATTFRFFNTSTQMNMVNGKKMVASITIASAKPAKAKLFFEGNIDGKHFWRAKEIELTPAEQTFDFEQTIPEKGTIAGLYIRFDFTEPGTYTIAKASMREVVPAAPAAPAK